MSKRDQVLAAFGRNVRKQCEANGLAQEALAERVDLDRTYISDIERGTRNPEVKNVARLAKALGISPTRLREGVVSVRVADLTNVPAVSSQLPFIAAAELVCSNLELNGYDAEAVKSTASSLFGRPGIWYSRRRLHDAAAGSWATTVRSAIARSSACFIRSPTMFFELASSISRQDSTR